ncbi:MAG: glutamate synthase-related protein [Syntrophobacteria bacterium]
MESRENCAGSCKECVKKRCVYGIFKENQMHVRAMQEPEYLYACQSCFRCVQECTRGIFSRVINPEYRTLGDDYWRPDIIHRTWYQAHTGKIPVSGAGYRGPFVGEGFDSMWTDMSEIVRPTRDGIHGREYINTCIELSRRITRLKFDKDMCLASAVCPILEVPMPVLFQQPGFGIVRENVLLAVVKAANVLGTLMFIRPEDCILALAPYADSLIPCLSKENYHDFLHLVRRSRMVELAYEPGIENEFAQLRAVNPLLSISVGIPLDAEAVSRALRLAPTDVDTLHFYADSHGNELNAESPRFVKEMIREVHLKLVENSTRQKVNLVFSGGIAMAEHMAKAIICGADGVTVDIPLLVALECRLCYRCLDGTPCPVELEHIEPQWGSQRIVNLMGAWRNQLLEVMGAMGIREARRLRGEVGRAMWFEDLERENFGPIFGERKVSGLGL